MLTQQHPGHNRLLIALAYCAVVIIWSTTPLTIKWSSEGVHFIIGIALRMAIGAGLALALVLMLYRKLPLNRQACKAYLASSMALFGGMLPVYWGAQYITSGLISVIFGLTPMITGFLAWRFIQEQSFTLAKVAGGLLGVTGLILIFVEGAALDDHYLYGVMAVLSAVILHSISAVWVKSIRVDMPALSLAAGGLLFSLPGFLVAYLLIAPPPPDELYLRAALSILYLGVVGSVLGFVCYYYLLKHLRTATVALVTLITPVVALIVGYMFNNEAVTQALYTGTGLILLGLGLHQWGDMLSNKLWRKRRVFSG